MNTNDIANQLDTARQQRTAISPFSDHYPQLDLETGYRIQRQRRDGRIVAGWKLGLTSVAKQKQVGVDAPLYGYLEAVDGLDLGQPLNTGELIQPRAEPEIVFVLGKDLNGPHTTTADALDATAVVSAGIEILDSRYHDYRFTPGDLAADNVSAGRYLVGPPRSPRDVNLDLVGVALTKNAEVIDTAAGAAVMGHPATAVAWLARQLHATGADRLRRGQIVFSGGLTAAVPITAGDTITAEIEHLGRLVMHCL